MRARSALALAVVAAAVTLALVAGARGGGADRPRALAGDVRLPDLAQERPSGIEVSRAGALARPRWRLGFDSAVSNIGAGPLRIASRRATSAAGRMSADQLIDRSGGGRQHIPAVGALRYVRSEDHQHWHLLGFERYELKRTGRSSPLVRDRKTGFCLGDRYELRERLAAKPPAAAWVGRCGLARPRLLALEQGISVGYGDDYPAILEGQWLSLDGLPAGRYLLVHRVNADGTLRESTRANNASSLLLSLRWRDRRPLVRVLERCARSERCAVSR